MSRKILQLCFSFGLAFIAAIFLSGCFFSFHKGVSDLNGSSPSNVTVQFSSATSVGIDTVPVYSVAAVLSGPSNSTVTVDYAVTGGTAVNGVDYTLSNGTLTFPAGATSELISINIINEGAGVDKTIDLQLSNPVNATLDVQTTHVHTITYSSHIYRSVGPSNTSVLACGGADGSGCTNNVGTLTISGSTATFGSAVPNNIGVGDAIVYDCSADAALGAGDCIAFISGRTSSTVYSVEDKAGATPTAYSTAGVWRIYRAYTSLADALDSTSGGTENASISAIDATLGNFDSWAGGTDLTATNEQWNVALYGDAADTSSPVQVSNTKWITSAANYIRIYAPSSSSEVGASQRHTGVWDNTKARIVNASGGGTAFAMELNVDHLVVDGLEVEQKPTASAIEALGLGYSTSLAASSAVTISNNIFVGGNANATHPLGFYFSNATSNFYIYNNIIYGFTGSDIAPASNGDYFVYNNTMYGGPYGLQVFCGANAVFAKNNIVQNATTSAYADTCAKLDPSSDYNISGDATSTGGAHDKINTTVAFANAGANDYLLSSSDTAALNAGEDLSADSHLAFSTDVAGISRPQGTAWDIGASEVLAATGNSTMLQTLSITDIDSADFMATLSFAGDANSNNWAGIYYCDATTSPGCDPLTAFGSAMTRGSGQFTFYATELTNSGTDTYNVEIVGTDADGIVGSPIMTTVTLLGPPTKLYRSVGPGNTSSLASGAANAFTISGSTATFASALPNNVGVGDAVVYNSNANIAFISGRTDSTHYTLQTDIGGTPTAATGDTTWNIYRAYTSLANIIDSTVGGTPNTAIPAGVRNFDTWGGYGPNLIGNNAIFNVALYNDGVDTSSASVNWQSNTSPANYLNVYTPTSASEVGASQRHDGTYSSQGYRLEISSGAAITAQYTNVRFDGLQIKLTNPAIWNTGIVLNFLSSQYRADVSNTIVESTGSQGGDNVGIACYNSNAADSFCLAHDNIVYGFSASNSAGLMAGNGNNYFYNNTLIGNHWGIDTTQRGVGGSTVAKNNIAVSSLASNFNSPTWGAGSDYNISSDTSSTGGAHDKTNATVTFVNAGANDYRLSPTDTVALDAGADLSADPNLAFSTDISGISRPQGAAWDIGASEAMAATSNPTEMLSLAFSGVSANGFTATATFAGDNNANNSATIYYCDATSTPGCNPLTGSSAAMSRAAGQFTSSPSGLTNSATDTYNVELVAADADGISGSPLTGTVTLLLNTGPTKIYRSAGVNTSPLACGATANGAGCSNLGALTISGTSATFTSSIPNNVGVGDAIQYQVSSTWYLAFIDGRTDSTHYSLQNSTGGTPQAASANASWSIYRPYKCLDCALWPSTTYENPNIQASLQGFDPSTGVNLVTNNYQWNIAAYADGVDNDDNISADSGWVTSATNYIRVYTPTAASEVGVSQRHNGAWSTSGYIFVANGLNMTAISPGDLNIRFDGLQIEIPGTMTDMVHSYHTASARELQISNNIFRVHTSGASSAGGISVQGPSGDKNEVWNNIIYDDSATVSSGNGIYCDSGTLYAYNNTVVNFKYGFQIGGVAPVYVKNNIVQGATGGAYSGPISAGSDYNVSNDATSTGGAHDLMNKAVTFVSASATDYRLSPSDTVALNAGEDLSADPNLAFNSDISDLSRPQGTAWDIGASEAIAATNNATEMLSLSLSSVTSNGFTATATFAGDNNSNNSAILYYCDATSTPGCSPTGGSAISMNRASGQFTVSAGWLPNGGTDTYNVEVVAADTDGVYGSPLSANVALSAAAIKIYRSVGPGNTSVLACGGGDGSGCANSGGNLTISGSTATFALAIPTNVGAGDALVYDCNGDLTLGSGDCIAFISARTDSTHYSVQSSSGGAPNAYSGANVWRIYRAYTSLANAVDFTVGGTENSAISGIDSTLGNFDNWTGGTDLVTPNQQWNVALYDDGIDSTHVTIGSAWTTSGSNYLKIYTPYLNTEVGTSQRQFGVWDPTRYLLSVSGGAFEIDNADYVWVEGLQISVNSSPGNVDGVYVHGLGSTASITGCLITEIGTPGVGDHGIEMQSSTGNLRAWNDIIYGFNGSASATGILIGSGTAYLYNNTVYGDHNGIQQAGGTVVAKNDYVAGGTTSFVGTFTSSDYNVSSDASSTGGANDEINSTLYNNSFIDPAHGNFLLSWNDAYAWDWGEDLSADPNLAFNTDVVGIKRPQDPQWDIGASELLSSGNNLMIQDFYISSIGQTTASFTNDVIGDANSNAAAKIYFCDDTLSSGCNPLAGTSAAMSYSAGSYFSYNASGLNLGDKYNVEVVAADPDGVAGSPIFGTLQLRGLPKSIYRSVGPGNSSSLASGASNALTISGSTATFASALPNNIGVGDVVVYASNTDIAFISGRTDSTHYTLQTASGGAPTIVAGDTSWAIYRAYTSVGSALNGDENTGIPAAVRNFDTWSGGNNLYTPNFQWNIAVYGDGADNSTGAGYSTYWTTTDVSGGDYLKIYAPYLPSEVGVSQRHEGVWDNTKARMVNTNGANFWLQYGVWIDGLEIKMTQTSSTNFLGSVNIYTGSTMRFSNNLFVTGDTNSEYTIAVGQTDTVYLWNNIFILSGTSLWSILDSGSSTCYMYNNTVVGAGFGLGCHTSLGKNNIVETTKQAYSGTWQVGSDYNISSDATSSGGAHDKKSTAVSFVNSSSGDYRIGPNDTAALDAGEDLSTDPNLAFNTDIAGISRPQGTGWDIGASELLASSSNSTEMLALTFSGITATGFTASATFQGDANRNNSAIIYYCDATTTPGCSPTGGASATMAWSTGDYTYAASGLTTGDMYNVEVAANDPDGVSNYILTGTATPVPTLNISNITVSAGAPAQFVVSIDAKSSQNVTFNYATSDGTATQPNDYTTASGSATITAGQTSTTIPNVTTQAAGAGTYFNMTLSSLGGAQAGTITATASLIASTPPPDVAGLQAYVQSDTRIDLSWNSGGSTTTGYEIAYQAGATAPADCSTGTLVSSSSINGDEYSVTGLTTVTQYSFRVCALDSSGIASTGATVTATTKGNYSSTAFATSTTMSGGNLGGLTGADATCATRALAGKLHGTYKAILSDGTTSATSRLSLTYPIVNTCGSTVIAANIWAGSALTTAIKCDETGATISSNIYVWTGTTAAGANSTNNCSGWTSTAGTGDRGQSTSSAATTWVNGGSSSCSLTNKRLYCIDTAASYTLPPPDVQNLFATIPSTTEIDLSWTSGGGSTASYAIAYQTGATAPNDCESGTILSTSSLSYPITGLTGGTTYSFRVCALDSNSIPSIGQTVTASIPSIPAITISNLTATSYSASSFTASINFTGDTNNNSSATLYYCDNTNSPGCSPQGVGTSVAMTKSAGVYSVTVAGLTAPINPDDELNLAVTASDADGVTGSPLTGTITLVGYKLVFTTEPSSTVNTGATLAQGPAVQVEDDLGHLIKTGPLAIGTVILSDSTQNGILSGTTSLTAVQGAATFPNNSISFERGGTSGLTASMAVTNYGTITGTSSAITVTNPTLSSVSLFSGVLDPNGEVNGTGTAAQIWNPQGITSDGTNVYFWEGAGACTIRQYNIASGAVTNLAGQWRNCGTTDGAYGTSKVHYSGSNGQVTAMATDGTYVYYGDGCAIRRITIADGSITTIAGSVNSCGNSNNTTGTSARFGTLDTGAMYLNGTTLYFSDNTNNVIRTVDVGTAPYPVTTVVGNGIAGDVDNASPLSAEVQKITSMAGDGTYLYFSDNRGDTVRTMAWAGGAITTDYTGIGNNVCGGGSGGTIAVIGTTVYESCINIISTATIGTWTWTKVAGGSWSFGWADGGVGTSILGSSTGGNNGIYMAPVGTTIYFTDQINGELRTLDTSTDNVTTVAGLTNHGHGWVQNTSAANTRFDNLQTLVGDGTNLYGFDFTSNQIPVVSMSTGNSLSPITSGSYSWASGTGQVDAYANGYIYYADPCVIYQVDPATGASTILAGSSSSCTDVEGSFAVARFVSIAAITTDQQNLYVFDNNVVKKLNFATQTVSVLAGTPGTGGCTMGSSSSSKLGVAGSLVYMSGNLYFTCSSNKLVQLSTTTGTSTFITSNSSGYVDGTLAAAQFNGCGYTFPMTTDGQVLYAYDCLNNAVRKIDIAGNSVTTLYGGSATTTWQIDGSFASAQEQYYDDVGNWTIYYGFGKLYIATNRGIRVAQ